MRTFSSSSDLAPYLVECLGDDDLTTSQVAEILSQPEIRALFDYGHTMSNDQFDALCKAVWEAANPGFAYPF